MIQTYGTHKHGRLFLQMALTANTGSTQATGTDLHEGYNQISVCANAGDAATLPPAVLGMEVTVKNDGAAAADIFPAVGGNLGEGANAAFSLQPGQKVKFFATSATTWEAQAVEAAQTSGGQYGITANVGSDQATGEPLYPGVNEVSTCANIGDSVTMPPASQGLEVRIINNGANACDVFPAVGDNLGAGANTAVSLAAGANIAYHAYDATNWSTLV
jgi:hypothetical protein